MGILKPKVQNIHTFVVSKLLQQFQWKKTQWYTLYISKCCSYVIQNCLPQMQDSGQPPSWRDLHFLTIFFNKTANITKQNWNKFLLTVKATALKQQK